MDERFLRMGRNIPALRLTVVIYRISNIQDRVQNTAENIGGSASSVSVLSSAVEPVLISALESLLEVVLILISGDVGVITKRTTHINRVVLIVIPPKTSVPHTGSQALLITPVYRLSQEVVASIIYIVVLAVRINTIRAARSIWVGVNYYAAVVVVPIVIRRVPPSAVPCKCRVVFDALTSLVANRILQPAQVATRRVTLIFALFVHQLPSRGLPFFILVARAVLRHNDRYASKNNHSAKQTSKSVLNNLH